MRKSGLCETVSFLCLLPMTSALCAAQSNIRSEIEQHYAKAQAALQSKQNDIAEKEFGEILRLDPKSASAHANLGMIAFSERDLARASEEFHNALRLQPALWNAKAFLGMTELRLGHREDARRLLEESFTHLTDDRVKSEAGLDLVSLDYQSADLDGALDVVRQLLRIQPPTAPVIYAAYRTYSDLAARSLANLAATAPDSVEMHEVLAQAAASQDDFAGAIAQYRKALEPNSELPEVHYELGQMILANSQAEPARQEAEKEFNVSLAEDPSNAHDHYMLGEIARMRSKPEDALAAYQRALALDPGFVDAHIAAGKALTLLDRPAEALDHLQAAVRLDRNNEVAHYRLAQAYRKLGRGQEADREQAAFRQLRDSHEPVRALYQQVQERLLLHQTIEPGESQ